LGLKGDSGGAHLHTDDVAREAEVEGLAVMIGSRSNEQETAAGIG